jgi:hypothetical protein
MMNEGNMLECKTRYALFTRNRESVLHQAI